MSDVAPFQPIKRSAVQIACACGVALLGLAVTQVEWTIHWPLAEALDDFVSNDFWAAVRQFPSEVSIAAVVLLIARLDPKRRPAIPVFLVALLLAMAATSFLKGAAGRARPYNGFEINEENRANLGRWNAENPDFQIPVDNSDKWMHWEPDRPIGFWVRDGFNSFPSGHATTAFAFALFLWILYPKAGRIVFFLAAGTALSRVEQGRHYLSDTLVGGAIGWAAVHYAFSAAWPWDVSRWVFRRFPRLLKRPERELLNAKPAAPPEGAEGPATGPAQSAAPPQARRQRMQRRQTTAV
ncbi:MAG: phosphatase PAP2 family protein [Candidatus Sumerlaeia bacterium]|nr:phosphatase PAP2 family protein [Candidatus Sumerlaeia bacterium]